MTLDAISSLSLGTAGLIIFAACAGFVLLRGITRMLVGTVVLGLSAWITYQVWQIAPSLAVKWTGNAENWLTTGLPVGAFLVSFFGIRKIVNAIVRPFGNSSSSGPRTFSYIAIRLIFALLPTSLLWFGGSTAIHQAAAIDDVRSASEKSTVTESPASGSLFQKLQASIPQGWLNILTPSEDSDARLRLAKLIATQSNNPEKPVVDAETGKEVPRAIVVDDPELQKLARDGKFGTLLRHPSLTKALEDPELQKILRALHF